MTLPGPPPGPPWGPAPWSPPLPFPPHDRPRPYHQILRTRTFARWRPMVGLVVFAVVFVVLAVMAILATMIIDMVVTGSDFNTASQHFITDVTPLGLLGTNLSLAAAIPAAVLAMLAGHRLRPGWLASVAGRMRWGLLGRFTLVAAAVVVLFSVIAGFLPGDTTGSASVEMVSWQEFALFAVVILLTTPLQAAGEEFAFRGYGLQALGSYVRSPLVPVVVTSLLFALAHGSQNLPLFVDRLAFGLVAGWLVVRTGGLEASIALHSMNNAVAFLVAAAFGQVGASLGVSEAPWTFVVLDIGQLLVFAWVVIRIAGRREVRTLTEAAQGPPGVPVWPR